MPSNMSFKIDESLSQLFIDSLTNDSDKARFSSVLLQHSGDFLNTIPSPILGLQLDKSEFIFGLKFCLGMQLYSQESGWNMSFMFRSVGLHGRPCNYMYKAW